MAAGLRGDLAKDQLPPADSVTSAWANARRWAEEQAQTWFEHDVPLTVGGVRIGWPLQIAAFEAFLRVAASADDARHTRTGLSPTRWMKRHGIDRAARSLSVRVLAGRSQKQSGSGGVLFVSEIPTPTMMEPSLRVADVLAPGDFDVAVADPRALRIWRSHGYSPRPVVPHIREEVDRVARGRREAKRVWRQFTTANPRFTFDGRDVTKASLHELRPLVLNSAPWLSVELAALHKIVASQRPRAIVVGTDQHRVGRLASLVAQETRTVLVVLQHGLPQTPIAYLPVVADRVAVWSEDVRRWFVENGTAPEKIDVVGNPRLDQLATLSRQQERATVSSQSGLHGNPRLLVALSPIDVPTNERILELALEAVRQQSTSSVVVKLPPGQGEYRSLTDLVRRSGLGSRVRIFRHEPLLPLLMWADLTLLYRSSVALESLAARTPVAVADIGGQSIAHDELRLLDLPLVRDGGELSLAMSELASDLGSREYFDERVGALERQIGPVDGKSAVRIADLLKSISSRPAGGSLAP